MAAHHREPTVGGSRYEASRVNGFARREVKGYRVAAVAFSGVNGTVCKYVKNIEHICNEVEIYFRRIGVAPRIDHRPRRIVSVGFFVAKKGEMINGGLYA